MTSELLSLLPDSCAKKARCATAKPSSTRSIGYLAAGGPPDVSRQILLKAATFRGILIGSRKHAEDLVDFLETANIHPVIDRVFSFEQAQEAYEYMAKATLVGKVVIRVD